MRTHDVVEKQKPDFLLSSPSVFTPLLQRNARGWMTLFLLLTDLSCLFITIAIAIALQKYLLHSSANPEVFQELLFLPVVFIVISYTTGLYPAFGLNPVEELRRQSIATTLVFLSLIGLTFITKSSQVYSRFLFLSCWSMALILLPTGRSLLRSLLPHFSNWGEPIILIGPYEMANEISSYLKMNRWIGLTPIAIFDNTIVSIKKLNPLLLPMEELHSFCQHKNINSAVVVNTNLDQLFVGQENYYDIFKRVVFIPQAYERQRLSGITVMEYGDLVGFEIKHNLLDKWSQLYKRVIDIIISFLGLFLLSPIFLVFAAIIRLDSPGRIFYRQVRLGKNDKKFVFVKFRTMQMNADQVLRTFLDNNHLQKKEWDLYQKLKDDPRITHFGKFLRRFSLDELPQLWNVLKGEMSLVGPRPILPNQCDIYGKPYHFYRRVNPGVTGLWQISGRNNTSFNQRVELDIDYVTNWSIWLDILILTRTFWVVLKQKGAF